MKPAPRNDDYLNVALDSLEKRPAITLRDFSTAIQQGAVKINGYETNRHADSILTQQSPITKNQAVAQSVDNLRVNHQDVGARRLVAPTGSTRPAKPDAAFRRIAKN